MEISEDKNLNYRPYSQCELNDLRNKILKKLKIGNVMVYHEKCRHFYFAKENGKKESKILNNEEPGYCSVCWKIKKTESEKRDSILNLVDEYQYYFEKKPDKWTKSLVDIERDYYKWVYHKSIKND